MNHNAAWFFVDRHKQSAIADKPAFIEGSGQKRQMSYRSLAEQSDLMAELYQRHDIALESRAAMLVLDTIEFPIIFWGSLKAGVIPIPLNTLLASEVYDAILRDSRASVLFVSAPLLEVIAPALTGNPYIKKIFVIGGENPKDGQHDFAASLEKCEPGPMLEVTGDENAFWLYSSGSTGAPKGVHHVHASLKITTDTYGAQVLGIREDDIVFSVAKMFFAYGLGNAMSFPMSVGATTILLEARPTAEAVANLVRETQPTIFCAVPTFFAAMIAYFDAKDSTDFQNIRLSISAGEALPEEISKRWKESVGTEILDGVGSTEMLHIFLSNAPDDIAYGTSGRAVPGYQLRLVDEDNKEITAPGEIGELLVKGESAAGGYWNQRKKTRTTFEGEWTRTGDKYELRDDGRFVYCGRTDDMFKVSGIWVSPFEVEQAIVSHPSVLEAAVVAQKDDDDLIKPKAYIVLNEGASGDSIDAAIKEHVKDKIGKWKYPRWVEIIEQLPKTATGKIQRFKLRNAG